MSDRFPLGDFHAVRFYESDDALCKLVAAFVGDGLRQDEPALVIATPDHRAAIQAELRSSEVDVERAQSDGQLLFVDAAETLDSFMVDDKTLDERRLNEAFGGALQRFRGGGRIRVYGEVVDLLWRAGRPLAAIELEIRWNEFAGQRRMAVMCGYKMASFYQTADFTTACAEMMLLCDEHTHVVNKDGQLVPTNVGPSH